MILGEKKQKGRSSQSEDLFFFRDHYDLGEKREIRDQSPFLLGEHQVLEILTSGP